MSLMFNYICFNCDAPRPWGIHFQDTSTPQIEGLIELHDNIMFYLFIILFAVFWMIFSIVRSYISNKIKDSYLYHGMLMESIWTVSPVIILILILIAFPVLKLLCLMDLVTDPSLTLFTEGHQWYWSYEYPDFSLQNEDEIVYDSYLIPELEQSGGSIIQMNDTSEKPSETNVKALDVAEGSKYQGRPISDLRWEPMQVGEVYYDTNGNIKHIRYIRSAIVYDKVNPSVRVSWFMHGENNHVVKRMYNTNYTCFVRQYNSPAVAQGTFAINGARFGEFAAMYDVTTNGTPVHPDANDDIHIERG